MVEFIRNTALEQGNLLLTLCPIAYLLWWISAYRTGENIRTFFSDLMFAITLAAGVVGAIRLGRGLEDLPAAVKAAAPINRWLVIGAGFLIYLLLFAVTKWIMKRPLTTELLLIAAWGTFECYQLDLMVGKGVLERGDGWGLMVLVLAVSAISLICYMLYYKLPKKAAWADGMIPLVLVAAATGLITFRIM